MKIQRLFWAVFVVLAACVVGQTHVSKAASEDGKAAVEQVLRAQQDAWNRHDLDAFKALGILRLRCRSASRIDNFAQDDKA